MGWVCKRKCHVKCHVGNDSESPTLSLRRSLSLLLSSPLSLMLLLSLRRCCSSLDSHAPWRPRLTATDRQPFMSPCVAFVHSHPPTAAVTTTALFQWRGT